MGSLWAEVLFKIGMALICGSIIGGEREKKSKPAGLRTNILICLGSTMFTMLSLITAESVAIQGGWGADPGRIAAQIVTGIGFLGGGMIIQSRGSISGLTSAATIWVVAAIGVCIGLGYTILAFICTLVVFFTLYSLGHVDRRVFGKTRHHLCEIFIDIDQDKARTEVVKIFSYMDIEIEEFEVNEKGTQCIVKVAYMCPDQMHLRIQAGIWSVLGVQRVETKNILW